MIDAHFYGVPAPVSLKVLQEKFGGDALGDPNTYVNSVADINDASQSDICFYVPKKGAAPLDVSALKCGICIVTAEVAQRISFPCALIITPTPFHLFAKIAEYLYPHAEADLFKNGNGGAAQTDKIDSSATIHPSAVIGEGVSIGARSHIGPNVTLGAGVRIGSNCIIQAGVQVMRSILGDNIVVSQNAAIGQAGFGFTMDGPHPVDLPQLGRVIIHNNVKIGSNTTIDRGALTDTIIGEGTRIDNLVQIAHGVKVGRNCIIVSQVGISGSTILEDFVAIGGQAGLTEHLIIGKGAQIAAQSGVMKSIPAQAIVGGAPAVPIKEWLRQSVALNKLVKKK